MNLIHKSLENIQATEKLKQNTLQYLNAQRQNRHRVPHAATRYALIAACLLLLALTGGYSVYRKPVSYISMDVNPSIELNINRFGRVVSTEAYNDSGRTALKQISLKNISYMQAIDQLIQDENYGKYLKENSVLVFTVISDQSEEIVKKLNTGEWSQKYGTLTYTSDLSCMHEAHQHEMSFGKYRTYLELLEYDDNVTIEDCHEMTMGELRDRIDTCAHNSQTDGEENHHIHNNGHECDDN